MPSQALALLYEELFVTFRAGISLSQALASVAERMQVWERFQADPERAAINARTDVDGPMLARVETTFLQPTAFSPLR